MEPNERELMEQRRSTASGYLYRKGEGGSRILCIPALKDSSFPSSIAMIAQQRDKTIIAMLDPSIADLPSRQFSSANEAASFFLDFYFNLKPEIITWIWQNKPDKFWALVPKKWSYRSRQRVKEGKLIAPEEISYAIADRIIPSCK